MTNLKEAADRIVAENKASLQAELDMLEGVSDEIKARGLQLFETSTIVSLERAAGFDTTLAQQAIDSSIQSLKAAGALQVATAVKATVMKALKTALGVVFAVL